MDAGLEPVEALTPAGQRITLRFNEKKGRFDVFVEGRLLMSSGEHASEEEMTELVPVDETPGAVTRVLVGGLGMGYTLRAMLDRLGPDDEVVVVELMPIIVSWNRGQLGHLAERPLDDPRVRLVVMDLADYLRTDPAPFDGILLDIDNGPEGFTQPRNGHFYGRRGLMRIRPLLRPGGALVVWSAFEARTFPGSMRNAGYTPEVIRTFSKGKHGRPHTLYVGRVD